jgi:hypothetical protein
VQARDLRAHGAEPKARLGAVAVPLTVIRPPQERDRRASRHPDPAADGANRGAAASKPLQGAAGLARSDNTTSSTARAACGGRRPARARAHLARALRMSQELPDAELEVAIDRTATAARPAAAGNRRCVPPAPGSAR